MGSSLCRQPPPALREREREREREVIGLVWSGPPASFNSPLPVVARSCQSAPSPPPSPIKGESEGGGDSQKEVEGHGKAPDRPGQPTRKSRPSPKFYPPKFLEFLTSAEFIEALAFAGRETAESGYETGFRVFIDTGRGKIVVGNIEKGTISSLRGPTIETEVIKEGSEEDLDLLLNQQNIVDVLARYGFRADLLTFHQRGNSYVLSRQSRSILLR